jgi:hypothetical protein
MSTNQVLVDQAHLASLLDPKSQSQRLFGAPKITLMILVFWWLVVDQ